MTDTDFRSEYVAAQNLAALDMSVCGLASRAAYSQVWQAAREIAFTPAQVVSPLAARPYDLRHAAISLWLNAGVPAPTVARRAGHSVEVLLRVYANCIDGDEAMANQRISGALG